MSFSIVELTSQVSNYIRVLRSLLIYQIVPQKSSYLLDQTLQIFISTWFEHRGLLLYYVVDVRGSLLYYSRYNEFSSILHSTSEVFSILESTSGIGTCFRVYFRGILLFQRLPQRYFCIVELISQVFLCTEVDFTRILLYKIRPQSSTSILKSTLEGFLHKVGEIIGFPLQLSRTQRSSSTALALF